MISNDILITVNRPIKRIIRRIVAILGLREFLSNEPDQGPKEFGFLMGEKDLDHGWVAANVPAGLGTALDIGCANSPVSPTLAMLGYTVVGIDIKVDIPYKLSGFSFIVGDFTQVKLTPKSFDVVVLCSTVEHIGLRGRFDNYDLPDGDLLAMKKVGYVLKPKGICILTIPVGLDGVFSPWHRIYGNERLPKLLHGFKILKSQYLVKKNESKWCQRDKEEALSFPGSDSRYALGQFVLIAEDDHGGDIP